MNQRSLDRLKGVKQVLIDILIEASKDTPYPFEIPPFGGMRTAEDQHGLFLKKVSKCDGYNKLSAHQKGTAFDIFLLINGTASWDKDKLRATMYHIKAVALDSYKIKLSCGCDWKGFPDFPHAEISK